MIWLSQLLTFSNDAPLPIRSDRVDHSLLCSSAALSSDWCYTTCFKSHCRELPHLYSPTGSQTSGSGAYLRHGCSSQRRRPEGIQCFSIAPYPTLDARGPEGCWHEGRNNVSKVVPRSSHQDNSGCCVRNTSSVLGTTKGLCVYRPHNHSGHRWSIPISWCCNQSFKKLR